MILDVVVFLASSDGHDRCPLCLGYQHAEAALVDESCSHCGNRISFEAPADDGMSIAASEVELGFGDDDLAALPPSGRVALPESDPELTALPFGLSLLPHVFTKVVEAALVPLREADIHVLNYLDNWLILAQSRAMLCEHRDTVLSHHSRLGLQVNWEKSKLSPAQRISFLGMELDSVNLTASHVNTSLIRVCSVDADLPGVFPAQEGGPTETLSVAPGAYGIRSCCHAARTASYETASALASRPGPEMGMTCGISKRGPWTGSGGSTSNSSKHYHFCQGSPSTRHAYRLKWNLFVDWCSPIREEPRRCPIVIVLSFLQDGLK